MEKGQRHIRDAAAEGLRDISRQRKALPDPPMGKARGDKMPGQWEPDGETGMPPDCPVIPLGIEDDVYWLIDATGFVRAIEDNKFGIKKLLSIFRGRSLYLYWAWPKWQRSRSEDAPPKVTGVSSDEATRVIMDACADKGAFSSISKVRGLGAWTDRFGSILWHSGDALWRWEGGRLVEWPIGALDNKLYPRRPEIFRPYAEPVDAKNNPCRELLKLFRQWNWERPEIDPLLLLGQIGVMIAGGALKWRSHSFLIGDAGSGKSTLQGIVLGALGDAVHSVSETTGPGIYQHVGRDSLPVAIDEIEAETDNRRALQVTKLARLASSGALMYRGGQDGKPIEFRAINAFFFSAINRPPIPPSEVSRLAFLRLRKLSLDAKEPETPPDIERFGPMLLRRIFQEWKNWPAIFAAYRQILKDAGHGGRGQDTYGTLLAMADMMIGEDLAADMKLLTREDAAIWRDLLSPEAIPETDAKGENWRECLDTLLQARVQGWRNGTQANVGAVLEAYIRTPAGKDDANILLAQAGLRLLPPGKNGIDNANCWLAVPNRSTLIGELFRGTRWVGEGGTGVWSDALRMGPPEMISTAKTVNNLTVAGVKGRCTLINMSLYYKEGDT